MPLRDLLGPPSVPDPLVHTGPAVVEDEHAEHPHRHEPRVDAFAAPPQDAPIEQQHGGPGALRAVPVVASGTFTTRPHAARHIATGAGGVPDPQAVANGVPVVVQIVGYLAGRRSLLIENTGAATMWIVNDPAMVGIGKRMVAGATLTLDYNGPLYAYAAAGAPTTFDFLAIVEATDE